MIWHLTPSEFARRAVNKAGRETLKHFGIDYYSGLKVSAWPGLERLGTVYGGWIIPADRINRESICYCAGVGEDISFDIGLIDRFGCEVLAFDPTPRAIQHVERYYPNYPHYHFYPFGLWDGEETLKFYAPADPAHVSHSALNLQKTGEYFEAPCRRLSPIMAEHGHSRLDLLKLDIEGAEYRVLDSLVEDRLDVRVICVEYDEVRNPLDGRYRQRLRASLDNLLDYGYQLVAVEVCNYTLVKGA